MEYLDFELPIKEIEDQIVKAQELENESKTDMSKSIKELEKRLEKTKKEIAKGFNTLAAGAIIKTPRPPLYLVVYRSFNRRQFH